MPDGETVINGLTELKKYLPSTMWEPINDSLALLKEQEAVEPVLEQDSMVCGECGHDVILQRMIGELLLDERVLYCPACGRKVKWDA